jgi:phosphoenolpyruvate synthase/pyruvate phosphate dikinase
MKPGWKKLWARKYAPFIAESYFLTFLKSRPQWSVCKNKLFVPEENLYGYYFTEPELEKLNKTFKNYLLKQKPRHFAQKYEGIFKELLAWAERFSRRDFSSLSNQKLGRLALEIERRFVYYGEWQVLAFIALEGLGTETENIIRLLPQGLKIVQAISTPPKLTRIAKAHLELLGMIVKNHTDSNSLHTYAAKYGWLSMYEFIDEPITVKEISDRLVSSDAAKKEIKTYLADRKKGLKFYNKFLKSLQNQPRLKKMVEISHQFAYLKDMRDDYRRPAYLAFKPFWKEVAKRTGLSVIQTNQLMADELVTALNKPSEKFKELAQKRISAYALKLHNGKFKIYSGKMASYKIAKLVSTKHQTKEIKGQSAFGGKTTGRAVIINHQSEFKKFRKNDILVTVMTHPEFLPIMRQAKAIVTDEGGITCHAAITAREFKVPCITGTRIATKVFKDGNIIEVDANKGIIKKMK